MFYLVFVVGVYAMLTRNCVSFAYFYASTLASLQITYLRVFYASHNLMKFFSLSRFGFKIDEPGSEEKRKRSQLLEEERRARQRNLTETIWCHS